MACCNIHLSVFSYSHYDFWMKKTPSGISTVIAISEKAPKSLYRQVYGRYREAIADGNEPTRQHVPSTRVLAVDYDDPIGLKDLREATATHLRTVRGSTLRSTADYDRERS